MKLIERLRMAFRLVKAALNGDGDTIYDEMRNDKWHETYIEGLKKVVKFCNKCGEYWDDQLDICSNPFCPEEME